MGGAIGLESDQLLDAMKNIDDAPPLHFHGYPAPGAMLMTNVAVQATRSFMRVACNQRLCRVE
jgi:hypothetical protein